MTAPDTNIDAGTGAAAGAETAVAAGAVADPTPVGEAVIAAESLRRVYPTRAGEVIGCDDVTIAAHAGEMVVIRGRSGSGKTTLLGMLGGLDRPTGGRVLIHGRDLTALSDDEISRLRRGTVGYIFQSFGLLPMLSAAENVAVPLRAMKLPGADRDRRIAEVLELVGLTAHSRQRPYELSGGQQQRVAIARALAPRPSILLADEPTGQLDTDTAHRIMDLISELVEREQLAAIVTTHFPPLMQRATRLFVMHDGRVAPDTEPPDSPAAASAAPAAAPAWPAASVAATGAPAWPAASGSNFAARPGTAPSAGGGRHSRPDDEDPFPTDQYYL